MDPLTGLAIAAPIIGGAMGFAGASNANAANAAEAQKNRDWQERMSNTAHQRARSDILAAGLNPALMYQRGGASSGGGAQAQMQNTLAEASGHAAGAARSYADVKQTTQAARHAEAQTDLTKAQATQLKAESYARLTEAEANAKMATTNAAFGARTYDSKVKQYLMGEAKGSLEIDSMQRTERIQKAAETEGIQLSALKASLRREIAAASDLEANAALKRLEIPHAKNAAEAEKTWWKRKVAPHLSDASKVLGGVAAGAGAAIMGRRGGTAKPDITLRRQPDKNPKRSDRDDAR